MYIHRDEALQILGLQPKNSSNASAWSKRGMALSNLAKAGLITQHPRGKIYVYDREEIEALERRIRAGEVTITFTGKAA